jgi:hypothetical protein
MPGIAEHQAQHTEIMALAQEPDTTSRRDWSCTCESILCDTRATACHHMRPCLRCAGSIGCALRRRSCPAPRVRHTSPALKLVRKHSCGCAPRRSAPGRAQVAPHAERVGQRGADDRRREALKRERPAVVGRGERAEQRAKVHRPGAEVAAVALADVHVPAAGHTLAMHAPLSANVASVGSSQVAPWLNSVHQCVQLRAASQDADASTTPAHGVLGAQRKAVPIHCGAAAGTCGSPATGRAMRGRPHCPAGPSESTQAQAPMDSHPSLSPQAATARAMASSSMFIWYESRCTAMLGAPTSATIAIAWRTNAYNIYIYTYLSLYISLSLSLCTLLGWVPQYRCCLPHGCTPEEEHDNTAEEQCVRLA